MPSDPDSEQDVLEVEAERLPPGDDGPRPGEAPPGGDRWRGLRGAFGPVLAGMLLDLADFLTPVGMPRLVALPVGAAVGWWVARSMGLGLERRLLFAAIGAAYCSLPGTQKLPLGTLVGILSRVGRASS